MRVTSTRPPLLRSLVPASALLFCALALAQTHDAGAQNSDGALQGSGPGSRARPGEQVAARPFQAHYKAQTLALPGPGPNPASTLAGEMTITTQRDCIAWTVRTEASLTFPARDGGKGLAHWVEEWRESLDGKAASFFLREEINNTLSRQHRGQLVLGRTNSRLRLLAPDPLTASLPAGIKPRIRQLTELINGASRNRRSVRFYDFDASALNVHRVDFRIGPAIDPAQYGTWRGDKLSGNLLWSIEEYRAPINKPRARPRILRFLIGRDLVPVRIEQTLSNTRLLLTLQELRWLDGNCEKTREKKDPRRRNPDPN